MVSPQDVEKYAKRKDKENTRFYKFLKNRVDEDDLDARCLRLHNELFADYDCSQCRNCCHFKICIDEENLDKCAKHLKMTAQEFVDTYLEKDDFRFVTKHNPCDFLVDNECILGDCKPDDCKEYPHTNKPERIYGLHGLFSATFTCPVVYELVERLKREYRFTRKWIFCLLFCFM